MDRGWDPRYRIYSCRRLNKKEQKGIMDIHLARPTIDRVGTPGLRIREDTIPQGGSLSLLFENERVSQGNLSWFRLDHS